MRILLTNDDGIRAPGLAVLERIARQISDDIWIVAPAEEQSGAGHSLTLTEPLRLRRLDKRRYAVRGTPTDCVMMALGHVLRETPPDLILSGVNRGPNLAEDVTYSGTVSAAMEGTLAGIPSIALSQLMEDYKEGAEDFRAAETAAPDLIRGFAAGAWGKGVFLNINFPARANPKGTRVTEQGLRDYGNIHLIEETDPRGFPYYWFAYGHGLAEPAENSDLEAVADGYVSVSPLHLNLTEYDAMSRLKELIRRP